MIGNLVSESTTQGIDSGTSGDAGTMISDNLVTDNNLGGIQVGPGAAIQNNYIFQNGEAGLTLDWTTQNHPSIGGCGDRNWISNNTFYQNTTAEVLSVGNPMVTMMRNVFSASGDPISTGGLGSSCADATSSGQSNIDSNDYFGDPNASNEFANGTNAIYEDPEFLNAPDSGGGITWIQGSDPDFMVENTSILALGSLGAPVASDPQTPTGTLIPGPSGTMSDGTIVNWAAPDGSDLEQEAPSATSEPSANDQSMQTPGPGQPTGQCACYDQKFPMGAGASTSFSYGGHNGLVMGANFLSQVDWYNHFFPGDNDHFYFLNGQAYDKAPKAIKRPWQNQLSLDFQVHGDDGFSCSVGSSGINCQIQSHNQAAGGRSTCHCYYEPWKYFGIKFTSNHISWGQESARPDLIYHRPFLRITGNAAVCHTGGQCPISWW